MQSLMLNSEPVGNQNFKCSQCGLVNFPDATQCKRCSNNLSNSGVKYQPKAQNSSQNIYQQLLKTNSVSTDYTNFTPQKVLGVCGSIVLFVGVFMPLFSLPIVGNMNYFQNGRGDGVIIIVLAGISLFLALTERYRGILITALASFAVMGFTFFRFQWAMNNARTEMSKSENIFKGLGEKMLDTVQLQWGWAILIVGIGLLLAAALIRKRNVEGDDEFNSARSNKDLYVVLAATGVVVTAWICLVIVPQFSSGTNSFFGDAKTSTKETSVKKEEDSTQKREPLLNALSVNINDKNFIDADFYSGRPSDSLSFTVQQSNKSAKDIRAFKGIFVVKDIFGDEITKISFKGDNVLRAGQSKKEKMWLDYNQFLEQHKKLRSATMENLRIEWEPETIMFTDGTSLTSNGEQAYLPPMKKNIPANINETKTAENNQVVSQSQISTSKSATRAKKIKSKPKEFVELDENLTENEEPETNNFEVRAKNKPKSSKTIPPQTIYEKDATVIRLPDGRRRLIEQ